MHTAPQFLVVVRPVHDRKHRKAKPRRDDLVRLRHPRARPDQLARQSEQTPAVNWIKPIQQRIAKAINSVTYPAAETACARRPDPERDEHTVNIDKDQRSRSADKHPETVPVGHRRARTRSDPIDGDASQRARSGRRLSRPRPAR
ncbi:hypothetical protein GCM10027186_59890 [Micromonospora schwarzwaldensis]